MAVYMGPAAHTPLLSAVALYARIRFHRRLNLIHFSDYHIQERAYFCKFRARCLLESFQRDLHLLRRKTRRMARLRLSEQLCKQFKVPRSRDVGISLVDVSSSSCWHDYLCMDRMRFKQA